LGTSSSNPGPGGNSPLVPPWADLDGEGPGPEPSPQRFRGFRISLGKFIKTGNQDYLRTALGHYSRSGMGGAGTAARRFAPAVSAGAALLGTMADLAAGQTGQQETGLDLSTLVGSDIDSAVDAIIEALCPAGEAGDSETIRIGLAQALSECLNGQEIFDPTALTEEMLIELGLKYIEEEVCLRIILDSGKAFEKVDDPAAGIERENELRQVVRVIVDQKGGPQLQKDWRQFNRQKRETMIRNIIQEVFAALEEFE
jgi:hypothetical protein